MENFENRNKNLNENSNQRDYDKKPLIIKDKKDNIILLNAIGILVIALFIYIFTDFVAYRPAPWVMALLVIYYKLFKNFRRNSFIYFKNNIIEKYENGKFIFKIETKSISKLTKTIDLELPSKLDDISRQKYAIWYMLFILCLIIFTDTLRFFVACITLPLCVIILNYTYSKNNKNNKNWLYNIFFIKTFQGSFLNFTINSDMEYNELKEYFFIKLNKNIDDCEKILSAFFEISEQDLINIKKQGERNGIN